MRPLSLVFYVNLLARYSPTLTLRHWNGVKHIMRYLRGTRDLGLFYSKSNAYSLVGYVDAGYLSIPHKDKSQTCYVFKRGGTVNRGNM